VYILFMEETNSGDESGDESKIVGKKRTGNVTLEDVKKPTNNIDIHDVESIQKIINDLEATAQNTRPAGKTMDEDDKNDLVINKKQTPDLYRLLSSIFKQINDTRIDLEWVRNLIPLHFSSADGEGDEMASASDDSSAQVDADPLGLNIKFIIYILNLYVECFGLVKDFMQPTPEVYCERVMTLLTKDEQEQDNLDNVYISLQMIEENVSTRISARIDEIENMEARLGDLFDYKFELEQVMSLINDKESNVSLRNFYEILHCLCDDNFKGLTPDDSKRIVMTTRQQQQVIKQINDGILLGFKEKGLILVAIEIHEAFGEIITNEGILVKFKELNELEKKVNKRPTDKVFIIPEINGTRPANIAKFYEALKNAKMDLFRVVLSKLHIKFRLCNLNDDDYAKNVRQIFQIYLGDCTFFGTIPPKKQTQVEVKMMKTFNELFGQNDNKETVCKGIGEVSDQGSSLDIPMSQLPESSEHNKLPTIAAAFREAISNNNDYQAKLLGYEKIVQLGLTDYAGISSDIKDTIASSSKPLKEQIDDAINARDAEHVGEDARKCKKLLFDLLDLTHDINCYQPFLVDVLTLLCPGDNDKLQTIKGMFVEPKKDSAAQSVRAAKQMDIRAAKQMDIRAARKNIADENTQELINFGACFTDLTEKTLNREESHIEFFKSCFDNRNDIEWLYKESGRILEVVKLIQYYKTLNVENQSYFKDACKFTSGCNDVDFDDFVNIEKEQQKQKDVDINVKLLAITHFDGCGSAIKDIQDGMCFSVFDNVLGFFRYSVFSNKFSGASGSSAKIGHLVVVTEMRNPNTIFAIFCFKDKVTLNSLIAEASNSRFGSIAIPQRGCSEKCISSIYEGSINAFINEYQFNNSFGSGTYPQVLLDLVTRPAKSARDKSDTSGAYGIYFNEDAITSIIPTQIRASNMQGHMQGQLTIKQTLLLLNKTIGDLIFTTYPGIKEITTIDSLVTHSVLDNFCRGNSMCLAKVCRKGLNGSTNVSPGMFQENTEKMSQKILNNMVIYKFIYHYLNVLNQMYHDTRLDEIFRTGLFGNVTLPGDKDNKLSLFRVRQAVMFIFQEVPNYLSIDKEVNPDELYSNIMLELIIAENSVIQKKIIDIFGKIINAADAGGAEGADTTTSQFYKIMYSLPDLTDVFRSNSFSDAAINETDVDLDDFNDILPFLTQITPGDDEWAFTFIAPGVKEIDDLFAKVHDIKKSEITVPKDYFSRKTLEPMLDKDKNRTPNYEALDKARKAANAVVKTPIQENPRIKYFEYTVKIYETVELLMQMHKSLNSYDGTMRVIKNKLLLFFKPRVERLREIVNYDKIKELLGSAGCDLEENIDENINECDYGSSGAEGSSRSDCAAGSSDAVCIRDADRTGTAASFGAAAAARLRTGFSAAASAVFTRFRKGGSKSNRASTRGKKLKYKRFTKRPTRRRSSLKQRTIKHYRKKHNTRRRYK